MLLLSSTLRSFTDSCPPIAPKTTLTLRHARKAPPSTSMLNVSATATRYFNNNTSNNVSCQLAEYSGEKGLMTKQMLLLLLLLRILLLISCQSLGGVYLPLPELLAVHAFALHPP
jgi:hypothetical protein